MAEARYERARNADDTDELLYTGQKLFSLNIEHIIDTLGGGTNVLLSLTDVDDTSSVFDVNLLPLRRDHCDLLLDSIDAQLSRLQVSVSQRGLRKSHRWWMDSFLH